MSNKVELDLVENCERYGLHPDRANDNIMGEIAVVMDPKASNFGPYDEFSVGLTLYLHDCDHAAGKITYMQAWTNPNGRNFKNGTEAEGSTFKQHHAAMKRYVGQQVKMSIHGLKFLSEPGYNGKEKLSIQIRSVAILSVPIILGQLPQPATVQIVVAEEPPTAEAPAPAPRQPQQQQYARPTNTRPTYTRPTTNSYHGFAPEGEEQTF